MRRGFIGLVIGGFIAAGLAITSLPQAQAVNASGGGIFVPVTQARIVYATNWPNGTGAFGPGETRSYTVLGVGGVPTTNVSAVVVELAARTTTATTSSYLTAWPTGETRPVISSMQYTQENAPRSNTAIVKVGTGGKISLFNYTGTTNVTVELSGYYTATSSSEDGGGFQAITPTRIANSAGTATGANVPQGQLGVGAFRDIQVAGVGPIGTDATSVFANIAVRDATVAGNLQVGPGSTAAIYNQYQMTYGENGPYDSGISIKLNSSGAMRITNMLGSPITFKIDVQGYFTNDPGQGASFTPVVPANVYSTSGGVALQPGEHREIDVQGHGNIPAVGVGAVAVTVTARNWSSTGTVTVYNADEDWPGTTTVSFDGSPTPMTAGNGISSTALVDTSFDGTVKLHNTSNNTVNVTITAQGWFADESSGPDDDNSPGAEVTGVDTDPEAEWQINHSAFAGQVEEAAAASNKLVDSALDYDNQKYVVYGSGTIPASVQVLASTPPAGMIVEWRTVPYTLDQIMINADRVAANLDAEMIAPSADYTRLEVTPISDAENMSVPHAARVAAGTALQNEWADAVADSDIPLTRMTPVPTSTTTDAVYTGPVNFPGSDGGGFYGRYQDKEPFKGGVLIQRPAGGGNISLCSSGFTVKKANGRSAMLTAAHCGKGAWTGVQVPGVPVPAKYGSSPGGALYSRADAQVITGRSYQAAIYSGTYNVNLLGGTSNGYSVVVKGTTNPKRNDRVCQSGAMSGAVCNLKILRTGVRFRGGFWGFVTAQVQQINGVVSFTGNTIVSEGDSGGPIWRRERGADNKIRAVAVGLVQGLQLNEADPNPLAGQPGQPAYYPFVCDGGINAGQKTCGVLMLGTSVRIAASKGVKGGSTVRTSTK